MFSQTNIYESAEMSDTGAAVVDGAQQNVVGVRNVFIRFEFFLQKQKVPRTRRTLVCTSMQGVIATMSGFQSNREVSVKDQFF